MATLALMPQDKSTAEQRVKLESGSSDRKTESCVTNRCERFIETLSSNLYEAVLQDSFTTDEVQEGLGNSIRLILQEVVGVSSGIDSQSSRKLMDLMAEEVMARVNFKLSNTDGSSQGSNPLSSQDFSSRLNEIIKHTLLKNVTAGLTCKYERPPEMESEERKTDLSPAQGELSRALIEGDSITEEPALSDRGETVINKDHELGKLCTTIVTRLVHWIVKDVPGQLSIDLISSIMTLKEQLYEKMADCDIVVKLSDRHIKKLVKTVYKDLCRETDSPEMVLQGLQEQKQCFYEDVAESLRSHLVTPQKKSRMVSFLRSLCWTRLFTGCFRRRIKD